VAKPDKGQEDQYGYGGDKSQEGLDQRGDLLSQYDKEDAAIDTNSDPGEVDEAWSDAAAEGDDG